MTTPFSFVESVDRDGLVHITMSGDVDLAAAPIVREQVRRHLSDGAATGVVMDLAAVSFLDSSGIGALVGCRHDATAAGKIFQAVNAEGKVKAVLDITGVAELLSQGLPTASGDPGSADEPDRDVKPT